MKKRILSTVLVLALSVFSFACGKEEKDGTVEFDYPEGFAPIEGDTSGLYYSPNYPMEPSTIGVISQDNDPMGVDFTAEELETILEDTYYQQLGTEVDINIVDFEKTKLDGHDALIIELHYDLMGAAVEQLQFVIEVGKTTTTVTYTQVNGAGWEDEFRASIDSMRVVYE